MKRIRPELAVGAMPLVLATWVILAGSVASAAVIVVPSIDTAVEGFQNSPPPFNIAYLGLSSQRYQQVFAASEFLSLSGPHLITHIAFRPDYQFGSAFSSTISNIQINLSTTRVTPNLFSWSGTFADNVGAVDAVVFRGPLSLSSAFTGPPAGPKDFDIVIPLQTPFLYDPTEGNLLLDVRNFSGEATTVFDGEHPGSLGPIARAFTVGASGGVNSPTLDVVDGFGLVTQFTLTPAIAIAMKQSRAERLGTTNAKVTIEGQFADASFADLDLGTSTVMISSILNGAGVELVAGSSLPLTLQARPGGDADAATFETPGPSRPKVRLDMSRRGDGVVSFRLVAEFAPSQKPASCAGTPRTTALTTRFQIDPADSVDVTTTRLWECLAGDGQLRVPVR